MSSERYTIGAELSVELEKIKGSRFIGVVIPSHNVEEMLLRVEALWREHPEARHICWAFRGADRDTLRIVDDGEPSGTAGRPILAVIEGLGLESVGVAVIRYFGGTKLGTGGLARAYSSAAQAVLADAQRVTLKRRTLIRFEIDYHFEASLMYLLKQQEALINEVAYTAKVKVSATLLDEHVEPTISAVIERTAGRAIIEQEPSLWI